MLKPAGVIFKRNLISHLKPFKGEIILWRPLRERLVYGFLRGIGSGLIAFAIVAAFFAYGPVIRQELSYRFGSLEKVPVSSQFAGLLDSAEADRVKRIEEETGKLGVSSYFSIVIPAIGARSNIIANVDAANKEEYLSALQKGVAHTRGTHFPGQGETIFLFAHSTDSPLNYSRYNAVFYLLRKLKSAENGETPDLITVYFLGKKHEYIIIEKQIVDPDDTHWITEDFGDERLILQTCDPPGTTQKRLLVIARPI